ncbi:hypothetical protein HYP71_gp013 [Arthrobacter phage KBurrousTX]|uniref:Uncharacterized protein n=1 Tax=Arthrobacter phage KBurrousTX TaxID=2315608 RepID=A0A386K8Z2_9CAUD|nr:hypothetical protein HYP71_gp013 [Arthrobacter phage KBurrousTX]AYD81507.1 hypothetical protein KBurrousTX_13 [Arthrobacter phage KBurrousTX]
MAPARRSASDALKGTEVKPEAEEGKLPLEAEEAKASEETKQDAPEADKAAEQDAEKQTDGDAAPEAPEESPEADEDDSEDEDGLVEAVVLSSMFNYFDEEGSHCSALKGATVHLTHEAAERGVKLGALKVQD